MITPWWAFSLRPYAARRDSPMIHVRRLRPAIMMPDPASDVELFAK
jgi:hypothetical protein